MDLSDPRVTHEAVASEMFGVPVTEVSKEQRRFVKSLRFGYLYGSQSKISPTGRTLETSAEYVQRKHQEQRDWELRAGDQHLYGEFKAGLALDFSLLERQIQLTRELGNVSAFGHEARRALYQGLDARWFEQTALQLPPPRFRFTLLAATLKGIYVKAS